MMYTAEPLVEGFPAKTESHGAFGWSSVWLLRSAERTILVDTGGPGYAPVLAAGLAERGLTPADVTDVLLTHAHWDHSANFTIFPGATTWIAERELAWARAQDPGAHFLSELHVAELDRRARADDGTAGLIRGEEEPIPGVRVLQVPGHTPGHLAFAVGTGEGELVLAGDAVKNIHELVSGDADLTMDARASRRSIEAIRSAVTAGALLAPGHDVQLRFDGGRFERVREQRAQVTFFASAAGGADRSIGDS